jgi:hypothetical protein
MAIWRMRMRLQTRPSFALKTLQAFVSRLSGNAVNAAQLGHAVPLREVFLHKLRALIH